MAGAFSDALQGHHIDLSSETYWTRFYNWLTKTQVGVREFGFKAIRKSHGDDAKVVFIFDSLEQIRGSLSNEQEVTRSVELLFSSYLKLLAIPYLHVVYTVPPWLSSCFPARTW